MPSAEQLLFGVVSRYFPNVLPVSHYVLPVTHYVLSVTHYVLPVT